MPNPPPQQSHFSQLGFHNLAPDMGHLLVYLAHPGWPSSYLCGLWWGDNTCGQSWTHSRQVFPQAFARWPQARASPSLNSCQLCGE